MIETLREVSYLISYMWNMGELNTKILLIFDLIGVIYFISWFVMYTYYKYYKHEEVPVIIIHV